MTAIRALWLGGRIDQTVAAAGQDRLLQMRFALHAFNPYHERVWQLRDNTTPYDAWYLAIAERLDAPLVTTDAKLATIPGVHCAVEVVTADHRRPDSTIGNRDAVIQDLGQWMDGPHCIDLGLVAVFVRGTGAAMTVLTAAATYPGPCRQAGLASTTGSGRP